MSTEIAYDIDDSSDEEDDDENIAPPQEQPAFPLSKYIDRDGHLSDEVPENAVLRRMFYHKGTR